eukprot:scaffold307485_cov31-Tisochrysis_lutea.AAC.1
MAKSSPSATDWLTSLAITRPARTRLNRCRPHIAYFSAALSRLEALCSSRGLTGSSRRSSRFSEDDSSPGLRVGRRNDSFAAKPRSRHDPHGTGLVDDDVSDEESDAARRTGNRGWSVGLSGNKAFQPVIPHRRALSGASKVAGGCSRAGSSFVRPSMTAVKRPLPGRALSKRSMKGSVEGRLDQLARMEEEEESSRKGGLRARLGGKFGALIAVPGVDNAAR